MLIYLDPATSTYQPWGGGPVNGQAVPRDVETAWTTAQLNAAGLYPVTTSNGQSVPAGQQISGPPAYQLNADNSTAAEVYPTASVPAPVSITPGPPMAPSGLVNAADDGAAANANVPIGGMYRNGSQLMIRVS